MHPTPKSAGVKRHTRSPLMRDLVGRILVLPLGVVSEPRFYDQFMAVLVENDGRVRIVDIEAILDEMPRRRDIHGPLAVPNGPSVSQVFDREAHARL